MTQHTTTLDQLRGDIDPTWSPDEIARNIDRRRIQRSADLAAPPAASSCSPPADAPGVTEQGAPMTIDTTGRAHKPAGSPASTGGQFAKTQTPGAAARLAATAAPTSHDHQAGIAELQAAIDVQRVDAFRATVLEKHPTAHTLIAEYEWEHRTQVISSKIVDVDGNEIVGDDDTFRLMMEFDARIPDSLAAVSTPVDHSAPGNDFTQRFDLTREYSGTVAIDYNRILAALTGPQQKNLATALTRRLTGPRK